MRRKWLMIAAGAVVGLLIADRLVLTPLLRHWEDQGARIASLRQSVSQGSALQEREESMRMRWQKMTREALTNNASAAEDSVLKAAARWARESRLIFTSVTPQWQSHEDNSQTLECRATGQGDLRAVTRFLFELESDPLPIRLRSVEITAKDERGRQLTLDARFSALSLTETNAQTR